MKKKKIILIHNTKAQWIDNDIKILSNDYIVESYFINSISDYSFHLLQKIYLSEIVYFWFGSLIFFPATILAKCMLKKVCIVAGGYDVASYKEEKYGAFTFSKLSKFLRIMLFKLADLVLPVSQFTAEEAKKNARVPTEKIEVVHNCVAIFPQLEVLRKPKILMVSSIDLLRCRIKGFDRFLEVVDMLPQTQFTHVGAISYEVLSKISKRSNLTLLGNISAKQLQEVYASHKVIVQFSRYESFCMSIVEGALQGCFPVSSDDGALGEIVKPIGKSFEFEKVETVSEFLKDIMQSEINHQSIREKTLSTYGYEQRRKQLLNALRAHF
ncbi:MAG: hypothetical protein CME65_04545 [Halobacteriovoraceae bacterium]|nr:hypothetical protein [Halobacteriovoraceae bacterium]|tara:strand:+ start:12410 stop:13387 length:978 start_codon:yes stop_codon:yes gene_type:complete